MVYHNGSVGLLLCEEAVALPEESGDLGGARQHGRQEGIPATEGGLGQWPCTVVLLTLRTSRGWESSPQPQLSPASNMRERLQKAQPFSDYAQKESLFFQATDESAAHPLICLPKSCPRFRSQYEDAHTAETFSPQAAPAEP